MFGQNCSPGSCEPAALWPPPELQANADIAGIGVLVGFIGTAYLAFVLLLANYLIVYDTVENETGLNLIDDLFLGYVRHFSRVTFPRLSLPISNIEEKFTDSIMNMCDVQIVTGLGILAGGVASASLDCSLSAYHWEMIVRLAWFSSITHLSGISSLRAHLLSNSWERIIRLVLMLILLICVLVALLPVGLFNWNNTTRQAGISNSLSWLYAELFDKNFMTLNKGIWSAATQGSPAYCYFDPVAAQKIWLYRQQQACEAILREHPDMLEITEPIPCCGQIYYYRASESRHRAPSPPGIFDTMSMQSTIFSMVLLVLGFATRSIRLFPTVPLFVRSKVREPLSKRLIIANKALRLQLLTPSGNPGQPGVRYFFLITLLRILSAFHLTLQFYVEFFSSRLFETFGHFLLILWGTLNIVTTRRGSPNRVTEIENQWTFGQVVPAALLIAPLLSIFLQAISLARACENRQLKEHEGTSDVIYIEHPKSIWLQTAARLEKTKTCIPSRHQSTEGSSYLQAHCPYAISTKILLINMIPGTLTIFAVSGLAFAYLGFSNERVAPVTWVKSSFLPNILAEQPIVSILYHLMVLVAIDRQGETTASWARLVAVNLYGVVLYVFSTFPLATALGLSSFQGFLEELFGWLITAFILIDLLVWYLTSWRTRKEGRVPGVPPIA